MWQPRARRRLTPCLRVPCASGAARVPQQRAQAAEAGCDTSGRLSPTGQILPRLGSLNRSSNATPRRIAGRAEWCALGRFRRVCVLPRLRGSGCASMGAHKQLVPEVATTWQL